MRSVVFLFLAVITLLPAWGQTSSPSSGAELARLENRVADIERVVKKHSQSGAAAGAVAWLFAAFCALWAQNTGRNSVLWFFLGLFFSVITVIVLLFKNAGDRRPPNPRLFSEGRKIGTP